MSFRDIPPQDLANANSVISAVLCVDNHIARVEAAHELYMRMSEEQRLAFFHLATVALFKDSIVALIEREAGVSS